MKEWLVDIINASDELNFQEMWDSMHEVCLMKIKEILGISRGHRHAIKETWWWSDEIREVLAAKKLAFREWIKCSRSNVVGKQSLKETYLECSKRAKKGAAKLKSAKAEGIYQELKEISSMTANKDHLMTEIRPNAVNNTKLYKIAAQRRGNAGEIETPEFNNGAEGNMLINDNDILKRWHQYCEKSMNEKFHHTEIPSKTPQIREVPDIDVGRMESENETP